MHFFFNKCFWVLPLLCTLYELLYTAGVNDICATSDQSEDQSVQGCYGGISTFYCASEKGCIKWKIIVDDETYELTDEAQINLRKIFNYTYEGNLHLSVPGKIINNGIRIVCYTYSFDTHSALFTVSDIPPVTNLTITFTVNNDTIMNCTWIQPSCLPVNYSYTISINNVTVTNTTSTVYSISNIKSCTNYTVSVTVTDTTVQYQSIPTEESGTSGYYEADIILLQDITSFNDITESTFTIIYKILSTTKKKFTASELIHNCATVRFTHSLHVQLEIPTENYIGFEKHQLSKKKFFGSYDESTFVGSYIIGPFNKSFKGHYTLMLGNLELGTREISTFHVQEVNITQLSNGSTRIECGFAINSDADGCSVVFISSYSNKPIFIPKTSTKDTTVMITDIPAGKYYVSVYDVVDGIKQPSIPAVTLLDITIDPTMGGPDTTHDPVSCLLSYMSTPTNNGLVSDTVSVNTTPSVSPSIITTTAESPIILYSGIVNAVFFTILLLLLLLVTTVISVKWHKHKKPKLTFHSEDAMTQQTNTDHVYSELPPHNNNSSVLTAVHSHDDTVDDYYEFNTSTSATENRMTAVVETAINDHDEVDGYHVIPPYQPSTSHENLNVLISQQEEMTQVKDSQHEDWNSIQSSSSSMDEATMQPKELVIEFLHSNDNDDDLQPSDVSYDEDGSSIQSFVNIEEATIQSSELVTNPQLMNEYSHCFFEHNEYPQKSNVNQFDNPRKGMNENNVVPSNWRVFYETAIKKEKSVVMKIADCYQIGESLGMDSDDVENALKFLTGVGTILYSPDDLPSYVMTKVQPLIERMSALFYVMSNQSEESEELCTTGIFGKAYLSQIFMKFEQDELSDEELLKIAEIVKIVTHVGDEEYFIPSALSPKHDEATQIPFEMYCHPLLIKWDCKNFLPQDLFYHMMVNNLLSSKVNDDYQFELCNDVIQWRNEIQIKEVTGKISGIIKLTDKDDWIEISTTTDNTKGECPSIYEAVSKAVTRTFKYAGLDQPTVTTLCPLCPSTEENHLCILSMADNTVTCSIDSSKTAVITEDISCWFEEQETLSNSVRPSFVQASQFSDEINFPQHPLAPQNDTSNYTFADTSI